MTCFLLALFAACTGAPDDEGATSDEATTDGSEPDTDATEGTAEDCATEPPIWGPISQGNCNSLSPLDRMPNLSLAEYVARTATGAVPSGGNQCTNELRVVWTWIDNGFDPGFTSEFAAFFDTFGHLVSVRVRSLTGDPDCAETFYWSGPEIDPMDCDTAPFEVPEICLSQETFSYGLCKDYQMDTVYPPVP